MLCRSRNDNGLNVVVKKESMDGVKDRFIGDERLGSVYYLERYPYSGLSND